MFQRLMLGVEAGERRQQRRVNVENAVGKLADETSAQQPHESGEADEIHLPLLQFLQQQPVVNFAIQALGWDRRGFDAPRARRLQTLSVGPAGNYHADFSLEL